MPTKVTVTETERRKSLARMLATQKNLKVGLTAGQKRALRDAEGRRKATAAA
jgi:hypothetical protein